MRVRDGFREFVDLAREQGWRVVIVSSGFHELIEPILEREGVEVELHREPRRSAHRRLARAVALRRALRRPAASRASARSCRSSPETTSSSTSATATPTGARPRRPTSSSRRAGWPSTSTTKGFPTSASTTSTTSSAVSLPEPFDFGLSTERFRAFGADLANLWHEGGVHRVFQGTEVRIEEAPGGVRITPGRAELAGEVLPLPRRPVRPRPVLRLRGDRAGARPHRRRAPRLSAPALAGSLRDPRLGDHRPADLAAGRLCRAQPLHPGLRSEGGGRHTRSRPGSGSHSPSRRRSSPSASPGGRPSTRSGSRAATSTSAGSPHFPTTR